MLFRPDSRHFSGIIPGNRLTFIGSFMLFINDHNTNL